VVGALSLTFFVPLQLLTYLLYVLSEEKADCRSSSDG